MFNVRLYIYCYGYIHNLTLTLSFGVPGVTKKPGHPLGRYRRLDASPDSRAAVTSENEFFSGEANLITTHELDNKCCGQCWRR